MPFDRKAILELRDLMRGLAQPFPDTITLDPKEYVMRDVRETLEARRERDLCINNRYGPTVKKSDFLKTTAIPTGPEPRIPLPFERVDLRRITNAVDPSLKEAASHDILEPLTFYYPRQ